MIHERPFSFIPASRTSRARKWIAAGILTALLVEGTSWWKEQEEGPEDGQIARRIEIFHSRTGGIHGDLTKSLRRVNARNYRPDREELNAALAAVLEESLPNDVKTRGILAVWLRSKGADPASFPILNRTLSGELLEWCLQNGADPNRQDDQGNMALHYHWDEKELVTLLNAGADISIRNKEGRTPLQNAILRGEPETVKKLLQERIDVR